MQLRELLAVPQSQDVKFERYSDSAASYVTLDPQNTAVYKQLFRAAKAKLKLRIKVTSVINEGMKKIHGLGSKVNSSAAPIIQSETASSYLPPSYSTANVNIVPSASTSTAPCETPTIAHPAQIDEAVAKAVNSYCSSTEFTSQLRDTVREEVEKTQQSETNDLISLEKSSEVSLESKPALEGLMETFRNVPVTCAYAIYCNSCNGTIHGLHYHCEECDGGDYDLCDNCTDRGIHCYERMHMLTRRDLANGKPVVVQNGSRFATNSRICNCCVGRKFSKNSLLYLFADCRVQDSGMTSVSCAWIAWTLTYVFRAFATASTATTLAILSFVPTNPSSCPRRRRPFSRRAAAFAMMQSVTTATRTSWAFVTSASTAQTGTIATSVSRWLLRLTPIIASSRCLIMRLLRQSTSMFRSLLLCTAEFTATVLSARNTVTESPFVVPDTSVPSVPTLTSAQPARHRR